MIELSVDYQVLAHRIGNCLEIPNGVAGLERLREMPHFPGNCDLSKRMRDGERLSELCLRNKFVSPTVYCLKMHRIGGIGFQFLS